LKLFKAFFTDRSKSEIACNAHTELGQHLENPLILFLATLSVSSSYQLKPDQVDPSLAYIALQNDFVQRTFSNYGSYYGIDLFSRVIWRYLDTTFWTLGYPISFNFCQIDGECCLGHYFPFTFVFPLLRKKKRRRRPEKPRYYDS
jgi:hypothetical protein